MTVGRNLLNATSVLRAASKQIEELFGEYSNHLAGIRTKDGTGFRISSNQADPEYFRDGWAQDAWRLTLLATEGGKRARKGNEYGEVTLAVDLGRDGWLANSVGEACLYVFWTYSGDSWVGSIDESDFIPNEEAYSIIDENIFLWTGSDEEGRVTEEDFRSDPIDNAWFFVVPLGSIDSRRKVHDLIAQPIIDLLDGNFRGLGNGYPAVQFEWLAGAPAPIRREPLA